MHAIRHTYLALSRPEPQRRTLAVVGQIRFLCARAHRWLQTPVLQTWATVAEWTTLARASGVAPEAADGIVE